MGRIIIVGDLFPTEQNFSCFSKGDVDSLFGKDIVSLFVKSDYRICNLEGALTDHPDKCRKTGPVKVAATSAINAYKKLGINCCMLANNHVTDGGHQGVLDTMRTLGNAGIGYIGVGRNADDIKHSFIKEIDGLKTGFYNVCETMYNKPTKTTAGVWLYDEYIVCRDLELLKKKCDYLIVIYHGGIEKFPYPSPEMRKRFFRMADNGADVILAQHTHCVGCEERYNGSYLLYGQGDFLLKNFAPGLTDTGLIIEIVVAGGKVDIKKHMVKSVENLFVRYNEHPDFSGLEERSAKLHDVGYVNQQLQKFCDGELRLYLKAFKSPSKLRLRLSRFFPKAHKKWLYNYNERDLMFILHTLRSEQNRETVIIGIEHFLNM